MENQEQKNTISDEPRKLNEDELEKIKKQDSRLVKEFDQLKLEKEAAANWDKFYKRNETRFFKDRHWTTREFRELVGTGEDKKLLLEVGCGVGNFFYPLLEDGLNLQVFACDFSKRAVDFVKQHPLYVTGNVMAFTHDLVKEDLVEKIKDVDDKSVQVDIISMIFVLSAIHPDKMEAVIENLQSVLVTGGVVLFRDYAVNDMAMVRFKPGSKLFDRFYVRQDGTRAYYFTKEELTDMFIKAGFEAIEVGYVTRQTVNKKENVNATRTFLQAKFKKI